MTEQINKIPARLKNMAKNGHVAGADDIIDDTLNKTQNQVNQDLIGADQTEKSRAESAELALRNAVGGLTQSKIIIGALPASGAASTIYRVPGTNSYSDYAWNGSQFVLMATYNNAIDDVPTANSNNLVKSGGIEECIFNNGKPFNTITSYQAGDNYLWKIVYPTALIQGQRYRLDVVMNSESGVKFALGTVDDKDKQIILNTVSNDYVVFTPKYSDTILRIRCADNIAAGTGDIVITLTRLNGDTSIQYDSNNVVENQTIHAAMKMDRGAFNVSAHYPTWGVNGGNTYTLDGALRVIPYNERSSGCVITFIDSVLLKYVRYKFKENYQNASNWVALNNWERIDNFDFASGESLGIVNIDSNIPTPGNNGLAKSKYVFLANGCYAKDLLVNTIGASGRVGVHFPIDDPTKTFHVKYSNPLGYTITVAILHSEKYTSGEQVQIIHSGQDVNYESDFTIDPQNYENAKYVGVFVVTADATFTLNELYIKESITGLVNKTNSQSEQIVNAYIRLQAVIGGNLHIVLTKDDKVIGTSGASHNYGHWASFTFNSYDTDPVPVTGTKYVCKVFYTRNLVGKTLQIHAVVRNNAYQYAFVTDYTQIPDSYDVETWESILVEGVAATHTTRPRDFELTVPENGNYLVVLGTDLDEARCESQGEIDDINERINNIDSDTSDIVKLNDEKLTLRKIKNAKRQPRTGNDTVGITPLLLLHFSDIHLAATNMARIKEFADHYASYINDVICTGDIVNNINNDWSFWNNNGGPNYLITIGNHESYKTNSPSNTTVDSPNDVYDVAIAPYIANWGNVVQPENATTDGKCYYYKDYSAANVRLIVLCAYGMNGTNYIDDENTWLQTVLADARTNNLSVLIAIHAVAGNQNGFDCSFNAIQKGYSASDVPADFKSSVNSFINDGGEFVGYIGGHTHIDVCGVDSIFTNQVKIAIDTASVGQSAYSDAIHENNVKDKSYDCFNLIAIDTYQKTIKIVRIGVDIDSWMRKKDTMCIQYASSAAKTITAPEVVYCT